MNGDVGPTPVAVQRLRQPLVPLATAVEVDLQFGPILLVTGGMRALIDERPPDQISSLTHFRIDARGFDHVPGQRGMAAVHRE